MKLATPVLAAAGAGAFGLAVVLGPGTPGQAPSAAFPPIETVAVQPGTQAYRLPGEYLAAGRPVDAPVRQLAFERGFDMMMHQVSEADYARCAADDACKPADRAGVAEDLPVTGVDHRDAASYAAWLSKQTGETWRLPTDAEWVFAAAERFSDDALGLAEDDAANPAARWLARYRKEAGNAAPDPEPKPHGHFGANSRGLADMSGNVWDWTSTCFVRASVEADGRTGRKVENCNVLVAGGKHRAYMSFFIRDGKSGGCAAGMAPHNLGIRLVREQPSFLAKVKARFQRRG